MNKTAVIERAIQSACSVDEQSLSLLRQAMRPCRFGKREVLIGEGSCSGLAYFLERGMTRSYWMVDGQEITTSFSTEGAIVFSMDEMYYGKPSEEYVEAVEPLEAFAIRIDTFRRLVTERLDLANWWAIIHQNEYRRIHRSHKERLTLPAAERYSEFARQFPDVCCRARRTDIASYLGITLPTLSRIRANLSQDK